MSCYKYVTECKGRYWQYFPGVVIQACYINPSYLALVQVDHSCNGSWLYYSTVVFPVPPGDPPYRTHSVMPGDVIYTRQHYSIIYSRPADVHTHPEAISITLVSSGDTGRLNSIGTRHTLGNVWHKK